MAEGARTRVGRDAGGREDAAPDVQTVRTPVHLDPADVAGGVAGLHDPAAPDALGLGDQHVAVPPTTIAGPSSRRAIARSGS
jgi:hypothetical protein